MDLKFTSLQERNVYNSSQIRDWCRDGDLETFVTGEFDIITIMGKIIIITIMGKISHNFLTPYLIANDKQSDLVT